LNKQKKRENEYTELDIHCPRVSSERCFGGAQLGSGSTESKKCRTSFSVKDPESNKDLGAFRGTI